MTNSYSNRTDESLIHSGNTENPVSKVGKLAKKGKSSLIVSMCTLASLVSIKYPLNEYFKYLIIEA